MLGPLGQPVVEVGRGGGVKGADGMPMALVLVMAPGNWRVGRVRVGWEKASRHKECGGLPARIENEESGSLEKPGRVWEAWERGL